MALLGLCHCIGFSLVAVSRGYSPVALAHGPSCFVACGIFRDQGSNPPFLYWQADSELLSHQGSLSAWFLSKTKRFHFRFPEFPYNNLLLWVEKESNEMKTLLGNEHIEITQVGTVPRESLRDAPRNVKDQAGAMP